MLEGRNRKILAIIFICFCWLPQMLYLYPLPQRNNAAYMDSIVSEYSNEHKWLNKTFSEGNDFYKELWKGWLFYFMVITFGIISGLFAYFNKYKWNFLLMISSFSYLFNWHETGSTSSVSLIESYELKWRVAKLLGAYGTFFYKDILLPFVFLVIILIISIGFHQKSTILRGNSEDT